jgi:thymidylate kinase
MIIVLNGPLGIGKSTLAEALMERIEGCAMLDCDRVAAVNPAPADPREHLHQAIAWLVAHHQRFGYRHCVIDHYWPTLEDLADLRRRLSPLDSDVRCFLLTLPLEENLRRIARRASVRAIDEDAFEHETLPAERAALSAHADGALGEPLDVSAPPQVLVDEVLRRLRLEQSA